MKKQLLQNNQIQQQQHQNQPGDKQVLFIFEDQILRVPKNQIDNFGLIKDIEQEKESQNQNPYINGQLEVKMPAWVNQSLFSVVKEYIQTNNLDNFNENMSSQSLQRSLWIGDYLQNEQLQEQIIKFIIQKNLCKKNCLIFLNEAFKKLKACDTSIDIWYMLLNNSMNYTSKFLFEIYQESKQDFEKINLKIMEEVIERCLKQKHNEIKEQEVMQLIQIIQFSRQKKDMLDILKSQRNHIKNKKVNYNNHPSISWKLSNLKNISNKETNPFKFNDQYWKLVAKTEDDSIQQKKVLRIYLKLQQKNSKGEDYQLENQEQNNNDYSKIVSIYFQLKVNDPQLQQEHKEKGFQDDIIALAKSWPSSIQEQALNFICQITQKNNRGDLNLPLFKCISYENIKPDTLSLIINSQFMKQVDNYQISQFLEQKRKSKLAILPNVNSNQPEEDDNFTTSKKPINQFAQQLPQTNLLSNKFNSQSKQNPRDNEIKSSEKMNRTDSMQKFGGPNYQVKPNIQSGFQSNNNGIQNQSQNKQQINVNTNSTSRTIFMNNFTPNKQNALQSQQSKFLFTSIDNQINNQENSKQTQKNKNQSQLTMQTNQFNPGFNSTNNYSQSQCTTTQNLNNNLSNNNKLQNQSQQQQSQFQFQSVQKQFSMSKEQISQQLNSKSKFCFSGKIPIGNKENFKSQQQFSEQNQTQDKKNNLNELFNEFKNPNKNSSSQLNLIQRQESQEKNLQIKKQFSKSNLLSQDNNNINKNKLTQQQPESFSKNNNNDNNNKNICIQQNFPLSTEMLKQRENFKKSIISNIDIVGFVNQKEQWLMRELQGKTDEILSQIYAQPHMYLTIPNGY
ncbi:hypothetical protein PPERSA_08152 [Pseudocohnilembus persalinus]|uniref:Uncharacterized protein n=1 Tax=Pseudocohnilembus persalinus TaxID=266149 RepID=A0A0V0R3Y9_PSEPJ|nr:hypothetical protein PPERSA_08152 [Pseudocohnilembus persalinus]|eukprot:KRX08949.1 hypothetical protein PPERSA_08152 [Pseudocohnilembus persalinus]